MQQAWGWGGASRVQRSFASLRMTKLLSFSFEALRSEDLLGCFLAGADAVGYADAAVAVTGEGEAGQLLAEAFNAVEALEMADAVLGHSGLPFVNACEKWRGAETENLL